MKIEIVGHHGGAQDPDGDVQHLLIAQDFRAWNETGHGFAPQRLREEDFVRKAGGNRSDQRDNEGFDQAEATALEREDDQNIHRGNEDTGKKRQAEEQFQSDGGAKDFGKIARGDGNFADDPKDEPGAGRIVLAASLRKVAPGGDAELRGKRLQKHRHDVADKNDA